MSSTQNATPAQNGAETASNGQPAAQHTQAASDYELDVTKLHSLPSEQQEIFLLSFVSDLLKHVESSEHDTLVAEQKAIKKELIKILGLVSPAPNRVIRNTLGLTFSALFLRGTRSLLFETINELVSFLNAGKGGQDLKTKHAAAVSLGIIFRDAGDTAIALSSSAIAALLKLFKPAQNHAGLRGALYKALACVAKGVEASLDEQTARDIWKAARNASATEKSVYAQRNAISCLEQLVASTPYFDNSNDFDYLKSTLWKAIETPTASVRHSAASCLATALVKSYVEDATKDAIVKPRRSKKSSKKQPKMDDEEDPVERAESPAPVKAATHLLLTLNEALKILSSQYTKATGNKAKGAIAVSYKLYVTRLPEKVVEDRYSVIAEHLLVDLLGTPAIQYNRQRLLLTRHFVGLILSHAIGAQVLGESAKITASKWLINDILKNWPKVVVERREPSKHTLIGTLDALTCLMSDLGPASSAFADLARDALFQTIQHPSYTVQINTAHCLRSFVLACPQQLLPCTELCLKELKRELEELKAAKTSTRRCLGLANALAAMLSTSRSQPLYGSLDVFSRTLALAIELFKASSDSELRISATQIQVAWILIGGLMPLGPNFVKVHLSQLLLLWKNALPPPLTRENIAQRGPLEMSFLAHVRECALGALLVFIEYNSALITTDGARRIASMLQNTISFLESLPSKRSSEDPSSRLLSSLQLRDLATMVRRRVLQCYGKLMSTNSGGHVDIISQSNVLSLAISSFTEPDLDVTKTLELQMAASANNFEGLCESGDNSGSGVTSLICGYLFEPLMAASTSSKDFSNSSNSVVQTEFEKLVSNTRS